MSDTVIGFDDDNGTLLCIPCGDDSQIGPAYQDPDSRYVFSESEVADYFDDDLAGVILKCAHCNKTIYPVQGA